MPPKESEVHPVTTPSTSNWLVTPDDLLQASVHVNSQAEDINSQIQSLGNYAQGLSQYWTGPAQKVFEDLMIEYNGYAQSLRSVLDNVSLGLKQNYFNYAHTEQTNLNSIRQIQLPSPRFTN
jgi:WXG100 family type VII secretion target